MKENTRFANKRTLKMARKGCLAASEQQNIANIDKDEWEEFLHDNCDVDENLELSDAVVKMRIVKVSWLTMNMLRMKLLKSTWMVKTVRVLVEQTNMYTRQEIERRLLTRGFRLN